MPKPVPQAKLPELEEFVDKYGLTHTLEALATICALKAEHVLTNWQDRALSRIWEHDARALEKCAAKLINR